jgi:protein ImuB
MLWCCVELPDLGLEVCTRRMTDAAVPIVLLQDSRVVACNVAARDCGIGLGSSLATAHSICRHLTHCNRDVAAERERLRFLADAAYRFSASVSIREPSAILLETSGSIRLFGGLYGLKRQLAASFGELGHHPEIGFAHTPLAALALARAKENLELARWPTADDVRKRTFEALQRVAIRHSECDADVVERLADMGIETLGQLARLPTAELGRRFGPRMLDYLARLSGRRPDPQICVTPIASFTAGLHFLDGIADREALAFPMQRLAQDLGNWLISRQLGVLRIRWRFSACNAANLDTEVEFAEPQQSKQTLLSVSRLKLERLELPGEVLSLQLDSVRLVAWQGESSSLFARAEQSHGSPAELIDRYSARLGPAICQGIAVYDDPRPEFAWRTTMPHMRATCPAEPGRHPKRPLWLLPKPQPVARRQLQLLQGPERIDVGWWVSVNVHAPAPRDYFIARHHNGSRCWAYLDVDGNWFIHGYFA